MPPSPLDPAFEADGSLRDVYIAPASIRDWKEALKYLIANGHSVRFRVDGVSHALPSIEEIFAMRPGQNPLLNFEVMEISIACHFFNPDVLELDVLPNSVKSTEQVTAFRGFLAGLANALSKEVLLTRENQPKEILWRVPCTSTHSGRA